MNDPTNDPTTTVLARPSVAPYDATPPTLDRRHLLRLFAVGAGGAALSAGPLASIAEAAKKATPKTTKPGPTTTKPSAATTTAPKKAVRKLKLGFIALTDAAPIIPAKELGYFLERGLDVDVLKQASWPALRDALLNGQIDGAHALFGMPFSVASGVGGAGSRDLKVAMILNQNGQGITLQRDVKAVGYADLAGAKEWLEGKTHPASP